MPTVRLNNGDIEADGSLNALSVTAQEVQTDNLNVTGQLIASENLTANSIIGNVDVTGSFNTEEVNVEGNLLVSGSVQTSNLSIPGTLDVDNLNCANLNGNIQVNGHANVEYLTVNSTIATLSLSCSTANADNVDSSSINSLTVNVKDTLNVSGDLIVDGADDRVLGELITNVTSSSAPVTLFMRHNQWYNTRFISFIDILADTDSGRVKTCYLISHAANPLVLTGVQWLWAPVDLEDTSKTHVIALQQIGAGPIMANVAYSYPV